MEAREDIKTRRKRQGIRKGRRRGRVGGEEDARERILKLEENIQPKEERWKGMKEVTKAETFNGDDDVEAERWRREGGKRKEREENNYNE